MKVLLTGGAGFLGRHLLQDLEDRGCSIRLMLHKKTLGVRDLSDRVDVIWGELADASHLERAVQNVDAVIHCAWAFSAPGAGRPTINEAVSVQLFEKAREAGVSRFAFVSSVAVYGMENAGASIVTESAAPSASIDQNIYPSEKAAVERTLTDRCNKGTALAIFRPGPIFDNTKGPAKKIIRLGKQYIAVGLGHGRNRMAYIHARDVAAAVGQWIAGDNPGGIFNVVPTDALRHRDWLRVWARKQGATCLTVFLRDSFVYAAAGAGALVKRLRHRKDASNTAYALACAKRDICYSNQRLKDTLGWSDAATQEFTNLAAIDCACDPSQQTGAAPLPRVGMIVSSYYPADPRVRREAEALAKNGFAVDVVCLRKRGETPVERIAGVTAHRLPLTRQRGGKGRYILEYAAFFVLAALRIVRLQLNRRFDVIHAHNMPDILIFTGIFPRLMGAKLVLDLHDPMPEVYMAKYALSTRHFAIRFLRFFERCSIGVSDAVITPNISFRNLFVGRGCPPEKIRIVMNTPQEAIFDRPDDVDAGRPGQEWTVMFHGTIAERSGLGDALHAIALIRAEIPSLRFEVYGDGDYVPTFREQIEELSIGDIVTYHGHQPLEVIAAAITRADIGIVPNRRNAFTEINLPTRIFEFLAMGVPVIAPDTRGIRDYFDKDDLCFFEAGNPESLAHAVLDTYHHPQRLQAVLERGVAVYQRHRWAEVQEGLLNLYRGLGGGRRASEANGA